MNRDAVAVHQHAKEIEANIFPAILIELALSLNDALYGIQDAIFLRSDSQSYGEGFDSSCSFAELGVESNQAIILVLVLLRFDIG